MKSITIIAALIMMCFMGFAKNASPPSTGKINWLNSTELSVKFDSFDATVSGSTITCNWTTEEKENNNYFELEKSFDGITYKMVAIIFTAENNTVAKQHYIFKDKVSKDKSTAYYRIRQINKDESSSFSKIITVEIKAASAAK